MLTQRKPDWPNPQRHLNCSVPHGVGYPTGCSSSHSCSSPWISVRIHAAEFLLSALVPVLPLPCLFPHLPHPPGLWGLSHRVQLSWAPPDPLRQGSIRSFKLLLLLSWKNHTTIHLLPFHLLHFRGTKPNSGKSPLSGSFSLCQPLYLFYLTSI